MQSLGEVLAVWFGTSDLGGSLPSLAPNCLNRVAFGWGTLVSFVAPGDNTNRLSEYGGVTHIMAARRFTTSVADFIHSSTID